MRQKPTSPQPASISKYKKSRTDPVHVVVSTTDPGTRTTTMIYDSRGRLITIDAPNTLDAAGGSLSNITRNSYYPDGTLKARWGDQTNATFRRYDWAGRLNELRSYRSLAHNTEPTLSTTGADPTSWTYSTTRGWLTDKEYADGKGTSYTYTDAGRLDLRTWERGVTTDYGYDNGGRLETTDYSDSTPDVTIEYNALGRQKSVSQSNQSEIAYAYDSATLAIDTETISYDLDHDGTMDFTRVLDRHTLSLGKAKGWELKDGSTVENEVTYSYHSTEGRLATVANATDTFTYGYTPNSSLIATVTGPQHTVTNIWESTRDVLDLKENEVGSTMISSYDYTVNDLGQRTAVATAGSAFSSTPTWGWGYDALGQVVMADSNTTAYDRAYEYDAIGNRKKSADSLTLPGANNYTANNVNQYTAVGALSPVYDDDGNATSYPLPVAPTANSTLGWDAENRMISSTVGNVTALYDGQSRRIAETAGSTTTLFVYDGWNCIAEYTGTSLTKTRTWGLDLSGSLQGAGGVGGLLAEKQGANTFYPTYDGNGNVSEYLTSAGAVAAHFEYDPFGNTVVNTDSSNQFSYRFSTKPLSFATGLYYYGYRYYDPLTGRWPSRDPIEERGGVNLYGFVGNQPTTKIDLLGQKSCSEYKKTREVGGITEGRTTQQNDKAIDLNGCTMSPDSYFWIVGFTDACNEHDGCYSDCGADQAECDKNLGDNMANACKAKFGMWNPNLYICLAQAATYRNTLSIIGRIAYNTAQNDHCEWECCE